MFHSIEYSVALVIIKPSFVLLIRAPIQTVVLERGPDGLGFSIVGGFGSPHGNLPIYIKTVFDRGAAAKSNVLKRGDQIVEVNGINLSRASHKEAVSVLKQVSGTVELKIISR